MNPITIEISIQKHFQVVRAVYFCDDIQLRNRLWTNIHRKRTQSPGCYAFYHRDNCLYVGKSTTNVANRILQHLRYDTLWQDIDEKLKEETSSIGLWLCNKQDAPILEHYLIRSLQPKYNTRI